MPRRSRGAIRTAAATLTIAIDKRPRIARLCAASYCAWRGDAGRFRRITTTKAFAPTTPDSRVDRDRRATTRHRALCTCGDHDPGSVCDILCAAPVRRVQCQGRRPITEVDASRFEIDEYLLGLGGECQSYSPRVTRSPQRWSRCAERAGAVPPRSRRTRSSSTVPPSVRSSSAPSRSNRAGGASPSSPGESLGTPLRRAS